MITGWAAALSFVEAGAEDGEGDSRCTPLGIPADSAFLRVEAPDGARVLDADFVDTAPKSPLVAMRAAYDGWRARHVCPVPAVAGPKAPLADDGCRLAPGHADTEPGWLFVVALALSWRRRMPRANRASPPSRP